MTVAAENLLLFVHRLDLGWAAHVDKSEHGRRALPKMGPRGEAVSGQLLALVVELEPGEHARGFRLLDR